MLGSQVMHEEVSEAFDGIVDDLSVLLSNKAVYLKGHICII